MDDNTKEIIDECRKKYDELKPVTCSIDWLLKYSTNARWSLIPRVMSLLEEGFVKMPLNHVKTYDPDFLVPHPTIKTGIALQPCSTCGEFPPCKCVQLIFPIFPPIKIPSDIKYEFPIDLIPEEKEDTGPHPCHCDMMELMRCGCTCGGV